MSSNDSGAGSDIRAEIEELLDRLDEESLRFLKRQAEIIIYTGELSEARRKAADAARTLTRGRSAGEANQKEPGAEGSAADGAAEEPQASVTITRRGETSFFVTVTGTRVFFNRDEMRSMTRIAHGADAAADGARRLHRWLARERSDFLKDTGAERPGDPRLQELWRVIVSTYKAD